MASDQLTRRDVGKKGPGYPTGSIGLIAKFKTYIQLREKKCLLIVKVPVFNNKTKQTVNFPFDH